MRFLYENEMAYLGANHLYQKLNNLNIDPPPIPSLPCVFSAEDMGYWLDSLENDLRLCQGKGDDYHYVAAVLKTLRRWSDLGRLIHVRA